MRYLIIVFFVSGFYGCVKDKPQAAIQPILQLSNSKKVYVVNEGGFGYGQASVSLYDPGSEQVTEDFYKQQNNTGLGDVAQSMTMINGNYYLVVNNSNKIIVCNNNFTKIGQINNLSSPRYIQRVSNRKAYVSDFSANGINIIDLNTNTKTGFIACKGWTEKMVTIYNKVFVTNMRSEYVYAINATTDLIDDSIHVGLNTGNIVLDKNDRLWTLNATDVTAPDDVKLIKIDPITNKVEAVFLFPKTDSPGSLCMNRLKDTLYFLNKGICRMAVTDIVLPQSPFIPANIKNFYGLGINSDNFIYAADALDYTQRSNIYIYNASGVEQSFFKAGIISNGFYFE